MLLFVDTLPTPDVTMEHASPGVRQVFEVLSLHADIFCNFCIGFGLLGHMSLEVNQHQPWPPPDELRLTGCDAELRPTPWMSFNMAVRFSVRSSCNHLWKPLWPIHIREQISLLPLQLKTNVRVSGRGDESSSSVNLEMVLLDS